MSECRADRDGPSEELHPKVRRQPEDATWHEAPPCYTWNCQDNRHPSVYLLPKRRIWWQANKYMLTIPLDPMM